MQPLLQSFAGPTVIDLSPQRHKALARRPQPQKHSVEMSAEYCG
jgi:hypothetical protein